MLCRYLSLMYTTWSGPSETTCIRSDWNLRSSTCISVVTMDMKELSKSPPEQVIHSSADADVQDIEQETCQDDPK